MATIKHPEEIRQQVRQRYAETVRQRGSSCCDTSSSCCCGGSEATPELFAKGEYLGYSLEELMTAPESANMSLGCGNPGAIASLMPGEVVLYMGSG